MKIGLGLKLLKDRINREPIDPYPSLECIARFMRCGTWEGIHYGPYPTQNWGWTFVQKECGKKPTIRVKAKTQRF